MTNRIRCAQKKRFLRRRDMIRLQAYDDCVNCIWFANPLKCNEYETCRSCPNSVDGSCICCEQRPESEEKCPHFKEKKQ